MPNITEGARLLIQAHSLRDVKPNKCNYVDIECVLRHFRSHLPHKLAPAPLALLPDALDIDLCFNTSLRPYQRRVVCDVCDGNVLKPSLIVMPCGSGKTLTALAILATAKKRALIVTNYKIVAAQWKRELLHHFTAQGHVQCVSDSDFETNIGAYVTIITYDTLACISSTHSRRVVQDLLTQHYGVIILDEAHKSVAVNYFCMLTRLTGTFIALTATPVREDAELRSLKQLTTFETAVQTTELIQSGFLAKIVCKTLIVPIDPRLLDDTFTSHQATVAAILNPEKVRLMIQLIQEAPDNDKIMVFCDDIHSLHYICDHARTNFGDYVIGPIYMKCSQAEREAQIARFVQPTEKTIIFASRTGDEGIDIPCASKLIQVCTSWGSRRQHAQRVGRIQRPSQDRREQCEAITIVSQGTREVKYAKKRDEYLEELKYDVEEIHMSDMPTTTDDDIQRIRQEVQKVMPKLKSTSKRTQAVSNFAKLKRRLS